MARTRSVNGNFKPNDDYEKMQFYYHPDHLGSSSYITNLDGEVMQHIEYVPYGEVFIDELELMRKSATAGKANCNNTWNTPYRFNDCANEGRGKLACSMPSATNRRVELNAKEFDEETGMYYYGARYYEPRLSLWMSADPIQEKYPNMSSYTYGFDNPIKFIDPEGQENVIVVGAQGESPNSDKYLRKNENQRHFLEKALKDAISMKKNNTENQEETTLLVYAGSYSKKELAYYEKQAKKNGLNFEVAKDIDDIIDYINYGSTDLNMKFRLDDKITDFEFIGHGHPQKGFYAEYPNEYFNASFFDINAFSKQANFVLNGCGLGLTGVKMEELFGIKCTTLMDQIRTLTSGNVKGYNVTLKWGGRAGLGGFVPFHLDYTNPGNDRAKRREEIPVSERTVILKGLRK